MEAEFKKEMGSHRRVSYFVGMRSYEKVGSKRGALLYVK